MSSRHHDIAQSTLARSRWQRDIAHGERASHDGVRLGLGRLFDLLDKLCDRLRQRFMFDIAGILQLWRVIDGELRLVQPRKFFLAQMYAARYRDDVHRVNMPTARAVVGDDHGRRQQAFSETRSAFRMFPGQIKHKSRKSAFTFAILAVGREPFDDASLDVERNPVLRAAASGLVIRPKRARALLFDRIDRIVHRIAP